MAGEVIDSSGKLLLFILLTGHDRHITAPSKCLSLCSQISVAAHFDQRSLQWWHLFQRLMTDKSAEAN